jgi:SAM-dependent methyltransferase
MRDEEYRAMYDLEESLWWYKGMRAVTASILELSVIDRAGGLRLLDVGCGTGYSLIWLRERFKTDAVFGVDLSLRAAQFWRLRRLDTVAVATTDELPFAAEQFDLVTCFDVIYQLDRERAAAAIGEMYRVTKPGGFLFIREPAYQWLRGAHDLAVGTRYRYTLGWLKRLLRSHGFAPIRSTYANTLLFWAAAPHRLISRLRGKVESDVKPAPRWMNEALTKVLEFEARLLNRLSFPFGLSVIALARKESL